MGLLIGLSPSESYPYEHCGPKGIATIPFELPKSIDGAPFYTTFAPTSSTTWGFAHSSQTSGCGSATSLLEQRQARFVAVAYDNLAQEMAQGGGHYLRALSHLMGCVTLVYPEFAALT